jgi:hypothetical protein
VIALASIRRTIFPAYRERLQAKRRLREHAMALCGLSHSRCGRGHSQPV